jgi:hypothetical protein
MKQGLLEGLLAVIEFVPFEGMILNGGDRMLH